MSWVIYGMRLKGDFGARYIGRTSVGLKSRLNSHMSHARQAEHVSLFAAWLVANEGQIEMFVISTCDTASEACAAERDVIATCTALGLPIFNHWLVPAEKRLVAA